MAGWLTGQWIAADLDQDHCHPGYFLPTVAGGFVASAAAAQSGFHAVAIACFGIGLVCWVMLGSVMLGRLFFRRRLPAALMPTLAIELAPPAAGGIGYLALSGPPVGTYLFGGYTVLMALVQVRLFPLYRALRFGPGFWAFTFAYSAAASYALDWLNFKHPAGQRAYGVIVLALITGFIGVIAVRSLILLARGQFLPGPTPAAAPEPPVADPPGAARAGAPP